MRKTQTFIAHLQIKSSRDSPELELQNPPLKVANKVANKEANRIYWNRATAGKVFFRTKV